MCTDRSRESARQWTPRRLACILLLGVMAASLVALKRRISPSSSEEDPVDRESRMIFAVSPGRAGSAYLSRVLACAKNVIARHEAEPRMTDEVLKQVMYLGRRAETLEHRINIKVNAISDDLAGSVPGMAYAETSHMFIKTFGDAVIEYFARRRGIAVDIIILRRDFFAAALSQARLGWFTPESTGLNNWYYSVSNLHPLESMNVSVMHPADATGSSAWLAEIVAYNADVEARARALLAEHHAGRLPASVRISEVRLEDLNSTHQARSFLRKLGLVADEKKLELLPQAERNSRDRKKAETYKIDETLLRSLLEAQGLINGPK
mmetsp:Transcript_2728/g.8273  ORF Transcript_2728/g.8273 Transcript_2728/m.8273 type:complete len:322 (+) Transcript_2728:964-1929(+)